MKSRLLTVAAVAASIAVSACSYDHPMYDHHPMPPPPPMAFFNHLDNNHDGYISRAEWTADAKKKFNEIDANHDGKISPQEWQAFHDHMREWHEHPHHWHHDHMATSTTTTTVVHHADGSTSEPPAADQATGSNAPKGADGAGGWTAQ